MVTEVHKDYNAGLPVDEIDASMLQFTQKIHGWIRDVERERDAAMEAKSKRLSVSGSASSKKSSRHSSVSSSGSRSSESEKALKGKLRMAELLTEVCFLEERQTAKFKVQKLKVEKHKGAADDRNDKKQTQHCPFYNSSHDLDECRNVNQNGSRAEEQILI